MWHLFATFLEPAILKKLSKEQKSVIASYINALNAYPGVNVLSNQAGDMLNLAHLVTEDFLLTEDVYTPKDITVTFQTFCRRKNLSLELE